jgi:hypothetical protein
MNLVSTAGRVEVAVERVLLRGFTAPDQASIIAALQQELRRHFSSPTLLALFMSSGSVGHLDLGRLHLASEAGRRTMDAPTVARVARQL